MIPHKYHDWVRTYNDKRELVSIRCFGCPRCERFAHRGPCPL